MSKKIDTPIKPFYLYATSKGLVQLSWEEVEGPKRDSFHKNGLRFIEQAERQINEYFDGGRKSFDLTLDESETGTKFQKKVWNELKKIPYGKTCSYLEIAKKIENEGACRAVGNANGKNPLPIVIPCHRVIATGGGLGGYTGGVSIKKYLLELESVNC